jgi:predicted dehydrogenase
MKEIKIGIVGLGWVAGAHIEAFKSIQGVSVTAVCSRRNLDPDELEEKFGYRMDVYNDYPEMVGESNIDVVDICTPHPFHFDQSIEAVEAGKHLILEKPICLEYSEAKKLREVIKAHRTRVCVCFECRFSKHFRLIRSVIDQQLLGEIHLGEIDYYHGIGPWYGQYPWNIKKEMGGSSLLTAGCHAMDAALFFLDGGIEEVNSYHVRSKAGDFEPYEYPTTSVTMMKFEGGERIGKVTSCIDCYQPYYFHIHLVGSEGALLDNRFFSNKLDGLNKDRWSYLETALIDSGAVEDHPYLPQFQAFFDNLRTDEDMPLTDFATAFETHRVVSAADRSAEEGRPVRLNEFD